MVAAVLTLLWRQVPGVQELNRLLAREDLLWCRATNVAQQSLAQRFLVFPAELFERVFKDLLPRLQLNWQQRIKRPLPDSVKLTLNNFERIWIESRVYSRSIISQAQKPRRPENRSVSWKNLYSYCQQLTVYQWKFGFTPILLHQKLILKLHC